MILSQNLKKGTTFLYQNTPYLVLDYSHIKMARSDATIRVKIRNLENGVIKEETFNSSEKFEEALLENINLQFLYSQNGELIFMDTETYEQHSFNADTLGDKESLLVEGETYQVQLFDNKLVDVVFPKSLSFEVVYTEPGHKGDTSTNTLKPATLENNMEVQVPLFINIGDVIKINSDTLEYRERVSKA